MTSQSEQYIWSLTTKPARGDGGKHGIPYALDMGVIQTTGYPSLITPSGQEKPAHYTPLAHYIRMANPFSTAVPNSEHLTQEIEIFKQLYANETNKDVHLHMVSSLAASLCRSLGYDIEDVLRKHGYGRIGDKEVFVTGDKELTVRFHGQSQNAQRQSRKSRETNNKKDEKKEAEHDLANDVD